MPPRCAAGTGLTRAVEIAPLLRSRIVARDAEHAHAIAAIGRRIYFEHRIIEIQRRAQILIERQFRRAAP